MDELCAAVPVAVGVAVPLPVVVRAEGGGGADLSLVQLGGVVGDAVGGSAGSNEKRSNLKRFYAVVFVLK